MKTQEEALQKLSQYYGQMPRDDYDFLDAYIRQESRATPDGSVVPEGYALVPLEPTAAMMFEFYQQDDNITNLPGKIFRQKFPPLYKAMLKAAADKERKDG